MDLSQNKIISLFLINLSILIVNGGTYDIKIITDTYINEVDPKFLSFQIDPKFLFSKSEQYQSKECMTSALTPAYLQVAGPSTSQITFQNYTIMLQDRIGNSNNVASEENAVNVADDKNSLPRKSGISIPPYQWSHFVKWAQDSGFDLVLALNNDEKTYTGAWDPDSTLSILTVAEITNMSDIYWQLGYKCTNQSIEEYFNDLETLRVVMESFPGRGWKVIGSDVTPCLQGGSDFRDYVTLAVGRMDAVVLNGNTTAEELALLSSQDRYKLLLHLTKSTTPLWFTGSAPETNQLERAADWITSLGYSARSGYSVHFRELLEEEIYEPTLSFYMALLYKNLVGERVLTLEDNDEAPVFAHCTSLRHKPVPGALTLYAVNMEDEPARYSIKLTKKEDGGDILQFILSRDLTGKIIVNGKAMENEGDIRPIVKRVRPYKTLLLNLPSKSFGFWVLANTKIMACQDEEEKINNGGDNETVKEEIKIETKHDIVKRSVEATEESHSVEMRDENNTEDNLANPDLQERINFINYYLKNMLLMSKTVDKQQKKANKKLRRKVPKLFLQKRKNKSEEVRSKFDMLRKILESHSKYNSTRSRPIKVNKEKVARTGSIEKMGKISKRLLDYFDMNVNSENEEEHEEQNSSQRQKRSIINENNTKSNKIIDEIKENEIDPDEKETYKLKQILQTLHKELDNLPLLGNNPKQSHSETFKDPIEKSIEGISEENFETDQIKMHHGLLNSTLKKLVLVLNAMNRNVNRFWSSLNIFE